MDENAAHAVEFLKHVTAGRIAEAYELVQPDGRHHNFSFPPGWDALRAGMEAAAAQAPDKTMTVRNVISDGTMVAVHSHVVPAPGDPGIAVVHLFRFADGKIAELWDLGQRIDPDSPNTDGPF
jgi:predicted SnoaL-like aldol condensation-catalyzing enzyme